MERRFLRALTVVALALGAAACSDRPSAVTSPTVLAPRAGNSSTGGYQIGSYMLLTGGGSNTQTRSAVIDKWGGKINFGATSLQVPYMAVPGPTKFTFTLQDQPYISAKLTAVAQVPDAKGKLVDGAPVVVFGANLTLTLSYASSRTPIPDPNQLKIAWIDNGQVLGVEPTSVDVKGKKLFASISHFSEWGPLFELQPPSDPANPVGQN